MQIKDLRRGFLVVFIVVIMIVIVSCGAEYNRKKSEDDCLIFKESAFYQEVDNLNEQLQDMAQSEEYILISGNGKKLNPEILDYSKLLRSMEALEPYYSFTLMPDMMKECGYTVSDNLQDASFQFFGIATSEEKCRVLSRMFEYVGNESICESNKEIQWYELRRFELVDKDGNIVPKKDG